MVNEEVFTSISSQNWHYFFYYFCIFCWDLEKLLHQLGVGHEGEMQNRKRSIRGTTQSVKSLENCNHKTERGWEQVRLRCIFTCFKLHAGNLSLEFYWHTAHLPMWLHFPLWTQSGMFFSQSAGGYFYSGPSFAHFREALQTNLPCHYSTVAMRCLWIRRTKNRRVFTNCCRE